MTPRARPRGQDRDLRDRVGVLRERRRDGVTSLVDRDRALLLGEQRVRSFSTAEQDAVARSREVLGGDRLPARAHREDGSLVHEIREIGAGEPRVLRATTSKSTSAASGLPFAWTVRIAARSFWFGRGISVGLSARRGPATLPTRVPRAPKRRAPYRFPSSARRAPQTQCGKPVSPTPSTGSDVTPEPSDRITNSPPAENTMYLPSGDHAGVYPRLCVSRVTPDPSGRIT